MPWMKCPRSVRIGDEPPARRHCVTRAASRRRHEAHCRLSGSFDLITNGRVDIIRRSLQVFDR
jgi:hypothetical protein